MNTLKIKGNSNNVNALSRFISAARMTGFDECVSDTEYKFENQADAEKALEDIYSYVKTCLENYGNDASSLEKGSWYVSYDGVEASI